MRIIKFLSYYFLMILFTGYIYANSNVKIGDTICVEGDYGAWYQGKVVDVVDNTSIIKVEYSTYLPQNGEKFDNDTFKRKLIETSLDTNSSKFRLPYSPKIGEEILALTKIQYYKPYYFSGKIVSNASDNHFLQYLVKFNEYKDSNDNSTAIINACRLFKIFSKNDYLWVKWEDSAFDGYIYGKVIERKGNDLWEVLKAGYDKTSKMWVTKEETAGPREIKPAVKKDIEDIAYNFKIHEPLTKPEGKKIFNVPIQSYGHLIEDANLPEKARPIGVGDAAQGGKYFFLSLKWPEFKQPVDVYLLISYQALNSSPLFFALWEDGKIHSLNEGLKPFMSNTLSNVGSMWYIHPLNFRNFPDGKYTFYLGVTSPGSFDDYYLWVSELKKNWPGKYSNNIHNCSTDIFSKITPIIENIENNDKNFYQKLKDEVNNYTGQTNEDPKVEAYNIVMFTSYFKNNLETFCWAALNAFKYKPDYESLANSAAVCLMELGKNDIAAEILDCLTDKNNDNPVTHQNAAFFYKLKGDYLNALEEKKISLSLAPDNYHNAWDGGYFVENLNSYSGLSDLKNFFYNYVAKNYPLLSKDGKRGNGLFQYTVCCNCNKHSYKNDIMKCVEECEVSLLCFTHICTPYAECCGGDYFVPQTEICVPPIGEQVCIGLDKDLNFTLSAGYSTLGGLVSAKTGISLNFSKGSFSVFIQGKAGTGQYTTAISSDPSTGFFASSFTISEDVAGPGGLTFGASLNKLKEKDINRSIWCEFYYFEKGNYYSQMGD